MTEGPERSTFGGSRRHGPASGASVTFRPGSVPGERPAAAACGRPRERTKLTGPLERLARPGTPDRQFDHESHDKKEVGAMASDKRVAVTLECTECKRRNYITNKSKVNDRERIELKKYCRWDRKHTLHKETR